MRGIHEPDDAVIDADRHIGNQVGQLISVTECRNARSWNRGLGGLGCASPYRRRLRHEDPDVIVSFLAGEAARIDAIDFQILVRSEGGNFATLSRVGVELPAVIAAFELFAVEGAAGKGHSAVRAGVTQSESPALGVATNDQRHFEQHGFDQLSPLHATAGQGAIPEAKEHRGIGRLALQGGVVHSMCFFVSAVPPGFVRLKTCIPATEVAGYFRAALGA